MWRDRLPGRLTVHRTFAIVLVVVAVVVVLVVEVVFEVVLVYFRLKTFEFERVFFLGHLCLATPKAM